MAANSSSERLVATRCCSSLCLLIFLYLKRNTLTAVKPNTMTMISIPWPSKYSGASCARYQFDAYTPLRLPIPIRTAVPTARLYDGAMFGKIHDYDIVSFDDIKERTTHNCQNIGWIATCGGNEAACIHQSVKSSRC